LSLHNPEIKLQSLKEDIKEFLKTSGWEKKLHNAVYREISMFPLPCSPSVPPEHIKEPLAYMRKAQANWEKRILKSLNSMCIELGIPLSQKRPLSEQKELLNKWNEMGTDEPDLSLFRPVYAPKDFLEVLMNLRNPNYDTSELSNFRNHLGLIQVPLNVRDIPELKEYFSELDLNTGQMDIDDSAHVPAELFESEHVRLGQKVLTEQDSAAAQQYVRQGSPNSLRAELWALILNISSQPEDILYYEQLKSNVIQYNLLVDSLIYKDVKLTASNDDYYFVFEDYLYQVLLCFSRDTSVLEHFAYNSATPPRSFIRVLAYRGLKSVNKLLPALNISSVLKSVQEMDFQEGIVSLCLLFENLLQSRLPQLFYHLREIGAQPSRVLLAPNAEEDLGSSFVKALLAAAVFAFRAGNLMEVTSLAAAE
ncbi:TBC1 domain family member 19, partial [Protobothrops mucrosquamatus]|uniref:TBC1 domain family member 19 n=1 Tax=Protobothrops mucrosquamatus TaxID=103944 RepID=UPI000775BED5